MVVRNTSGEAITESPTGWGIEAGNPTSGVILHVPHASREIPAAERWRILLDDADLEAELDAITDADTDRLARAAGTRA